MTCDPAAPKPPLKRRHWLRRFMGAVVLLVLLAALWFGWGWRHWPHAQLFPAVAGLSHTEKFHRVFADSAPSPVSTEILAKALAQPVVSITDKPHLSPRGDDRDYVSISIYWWPNPLTRMPWIHRDGQRNPLAETYDAPRLRSLVKTVRTLAAAGDPAADTRAMEWLSAWFIAPATAMHPHLTFAQMMPGIAAGGRQGIIEGLPICTELLDALAWLDARDAISDHDRAVLRDWLARYLAWLMESGPGRVESTRANNHGTWHDVQVAALAVSLGLDQLARDTLKHSRTRLAGQFLADGRQPEELRRTESFNYSAYNLDAWLRLAQLDRELELNRLSALTHEGAVIEQGIRYLEQHTQPGNEWSHPHLSPIKPALVQQLRQRWDRLRVNVVPSAASE